MQHQSFDQCTNRDLLHFDFASSSFDFYVPGPEVIDAFEAFLSENEIQRVLTAITNGTGEGYINTLLVENERFFPSRTSAKFNSKPLEFNQNRQLPHHTAEGSTNRKGPPAKTIFYSVDINLPVGQTPTLPVVPQNVFENGVVSRLQEGWMPTWGAALTDATHTFPTKDKHEPPCVCKEIVLTNDKSQFEYSSIRTGGVPTVSKVEPCSFTFTAISVVEGLAPSDPITATFTIVGPTLDAQGPAPTKPDSGDNIIDGSGGFATRAEEAVEEDEVEDPNLQEIFKDRQAELANVAKMNPEERKQWIQNEAKSIRDKVTATNARDDEEATPGFVFTVNEDDANALGEDATRAAAAAQKELLAVWDVEEKQMIEAGIPQSQQWLRRSAFMKASKQGESVAAGSGVEGAAKMLQIDNPVMQARMAAQEQARLKDEAEQKDKASVAAAELVEKDRAEAAANAILLATDKKTVEAAAAAERMTVALAKDAKFFKKKMGDATSRQQAMLDAKKAQFAEAEAVASKIDMSTALNFEEQKKK
jgi:hypothetical protein